MVLGVGNPLRHDDAAGIEVARQLAPRLNAAEYRVREHGGEALGLIEQWDGAAATIVLDATRSGAPPGTIHRFDASLCALPAELRGPTSTHAVGLAETIELARALGRLPARVIVYGIEGARFDAGAGLSEELLAVIGELAARVVQEAGALTRACR